ncbi:hypothetical protein GCM10027055_13190 [Janibacter alkaliphilus]|uniref:Putative membrane protein YhhN n=1 Tax=Janibacter alkaliphilus TaxID=1069963 RepID=A0A852X879_9MICO|nr:lysoplasmalogenase [Janibacter alkaliphilus]NYG37690.1 putative membrane protein YhhN [Janibacter alkaliphilus]
MPGSPLRRGALWALTAGAFVADWVAVATSNRPLELVAKPGAMVALGAASIGSGLLQRPWGRAVTTGLAFGLIGDVCLLWGEHEPAFLAGLSSFLVGHLAYVVAFRQMGTHRTWWALGGAAVVAGCAWWSRDALPNLLADGGVAAAAPVAAYMGVIAAMTVSAWATKDPLVAIGSSIFVLSDTVIAVDQFVAPVEHSGLKIMVPYLLGQALVAIGAVRRRAPALP